MNLNTIRIDDGQPLTEAELDARIAQRTGSQPWPLEYAVHTSECSDDCADNDHALPGAPIAILLLIAAICFVAGLIWLIWRLS